MGMPKKERGGESGHLAGRNTKHNEPWSRRETIFSLVNLLLFIHSPPPLFCESDSTQVNYEAESWAKDANWSPATPSLVTPPLGSPMWASIYRPINVSHEISLVLSTALTQIAVNGPAATRNQTTPWGAEQILAPKSHFSPSVSLPPPTTYLPLVRAANRQQCAAIDGVYSRHLKRWGDVLLGTASTG